MINVIIDLILIPRFGFVGACIGTLAAEISLFGTAIYYAGTIDKNISFIRASFKPVLSGVLMWFVLDQFKDFSIIWMLLGILLSLLTYILSILALRTFSKGEIKTFKTINFRE